MSLYERKQPIIQNYTNNIISYTGTTFNICKGLLKNYTVHTTLSNESETDTNGNYTTDYDDVYYKKSTQKILQNMYDPSKQRSGKICMRAAPEPKHRKNGLDESWMASTRTQGSRNHPLGSGVWESPFLWDGSMKESQKQLFGITDKSQEYQILVGNASGGSGQARNFEVTRIWSTISVCGIPAKCYYQKELELQTQTSQYFNTLFDNKCGFIIYISKYDGNTNDHGNNLHFNIAKIGLFKIDTTQLSNSQLKNIIDNY